MPRYLSLGSIPQKRHTAHRTSRATRTRASTTRKSSARTGFAGPIASSTTSGRRRA